MCQEFSSSGGHGRKMIRYVTLTPFITRARDRGNVHIQLKSGIEKEIEAGQINTVTLSKFEEEILTTQSVLGR